MICIWRAHIEGQAGAKELLAVSPGSCSPLPTEHGGHCVQHALWLARAGAKALAQPLCRTFFCPASGQFQIWARMHSQYLVIPMCPFASNVIGSHAAPPDATLLHFFSKDIFRTMFFCMRSQKGTFKRFPTKWYTFSLFESLERSPWPRPERCSFCFVRLQRS